MKDLPSHVNESGEARVRAVMVYSACVDVFHRTSSIAFQDYFPAVRRSVTVSTALAMLGARGEISRSAWGRPLG